ncbi:MAG: tetratricopeptide repeat protein [Armatimonadota bacterium]|nr:tetratricopeptide repeat protein [bacterium]MDW8321193.1 tetratricopeptide repeat protein [Armatimonadota bacterium]
MALRAASTHHEERVIRHVRWAFGGIGAAAGAIAFWTLHPAAAVVGSIAGATAGALMVYRKAVVALARKWSLEEPPRTSRMAFAFYLAALKCNSLDDISRARLERCLVDSDVSNGVFSAGRVAIYRRRFAVQPDDPGPAFLLTAAYKQGWLPQDEQMVAVWTQVVREEWKEHPLWNRFNLSRTKLLEDLANLILREGNVTPECVDVVARAYAANPNHSGWLTYLARAYPPRTDPEALKIYYAFFKHSPRDSTNTRFLADYVVEHLQGKPWEAEVLRAAAALAGAERARYIVALARCYALMQCTEQHALAVYREAFALTPEDMQTLGALALALARNKVYDEQAEEIYTRVLKNEKALATAIEEVGGSLAEVQSAMAHCLAQRGAQTKSAISLYAKAFEHDPSDAVVAYAYARALAAAENHSQKATQVYVVAHKNYPDDTEILVALAKAYAQNGVTNHEATHIYQKVLHARKEWPGMCESIAALYAREKRPPELALQLWKRLAEEQPQNAQVRKWIAAEYLRRREAKNALTYYQLAAEIAPDDFEAQLMTGKLLLEYTNDLNGALQALQAAVSLQPLHLEANLLLGNTLARLEVYPAALMVFEHVLDNIDNNCVHALRMTAQMKHLTDHDVLAAVKLYERAVTIEPENIEIWKELAEFSKDHGMVDREIRALETLARLDPRESTHHVRLGELYVIDGDFQRAEEHLRQAIALGAQGTTVFTLLGEVATRVRRSA